MPVFMLVFIFSVYFNLCLFYFFCLFIYLIYLYLFTLYSPNFMCYFVVTGITEKQRLLDVIS
jgi:hypothetical protein